MVVDVGADDAMRLLLLGQRLLVDANRAQVTEQVFTVTEPPEQVVHLLLRVLVRHLPQHMFINTTTHVVVQPLFAQKSQELTTTT